jgi:hypothetical protein
MPDSTARPAIAVGDLFESDGRGRTLWAVEAILKVPRQGTFIRLAEIEGLGRVTLPAFDLDIPMGFRCTKRHGVSVAS